ncbi:hypothetical protein [Mesorhizobium wenxiniae]|nr:hypothetical protein [Mesorhizobium wenxiniae]
MTEVYQASPVKRCRATKLKAAENSARELIATPVGQIGEAA